MVRYFRPTALIVMILAAWAQLACVAQSVAGNPDATYTLAGTVVNAETGRPIPRALVELYSMGKKAVLTGPQGEFSFDKLSKGSVMVRVQKPGFFELGSRQQMQAAEYVVVGPDSGKVVLKLQPECAIAGEVTDDNGEPMEGVIVDALASQIMDGHRQLMPVRGSARTDEDGLFHMAGLQSGKYILSVKSGPAGRRLLGLQSSKGSQAYPLIVYSPGVTDPAAATPVDLAPGQHAHIQFSLSLGPAFKLSGTVLGAANFKQVSPPMIVDAMERPLASANRWDAQTGAFEISPLPAGVYTLRVYAMTDEGHSSSLKQSVTLNRDISGLNLAMTAGVAIPVSVRADFTQPQHCTSHVGAAIDCRQFALVNLMSAEPGQIVAQAQPDKADSSILAFQNVMAGRYRVQVYPLVQAYVRSVRSGTTDLLQEELVVPAGGNVPPIEVVLRDDGAKVKIHIQAEDAPPLVQILMLPEFAPSQRALNFKTSPGSDFEYGGLAPGDYKILAIASPEEIEYGNPEVLQKYSAKTARITLTSNGTTNVTVELIREGE